MTKVDNIEAEVLSKVKGEYSSLILFGSYARGDYNPYSDVDVLQIVRKPKESYKENNINFSVYTLGYLSKMAEDGSLFILHIIQDGKLLKGKKQDLLILKQNFIKKESYASFRKNLIDASSLLDFDEEFYKKNFKGANSLVAYLLRSYIYSLLHDQGKMIFSMHDASTLLKDPRIKKISQLKDMAYPDYNKFLKYRSLLEEYMGKKISNPYKSLDALIVNSSIEGKELTRSLGLRLIRSSDSTITYG